MLLLRFDSRVLRPKQDWVSREHSLKVALVGGGGLKRDLELLDREAKRTENPARFGERLEFAPHRLDHHPHLGGHDRLGAREQLDRISRLEVERCHARVPHPCGLATVRQGKATGEGLPLIGPQFGLKLGDVWNDRGPVRVRQANRPQDVLLVDVHRHERGPYRHFSGPEVESVGDVQKPGFAVLIAVDDLPRGSDQLTGGELGALPLRFGLRTRSCQAAWSGSSSVSCRCRGEIAMDASPTIRAATCAEA
jgi:hypothetical protein